LQIKSRRAFVLNKLNCAASFDSQGDNVVPFLDLKAQYQSIKPEIDAAVSRVLGSTQFVLGPEVTEFETDFAAYCQTRHCVAVNSGTSALHLALLAAGVGPGDEVITVSMTFVATTAAIIYCGATPVFVDVDPERCTMDPALIEGAITPRTRAIVPVHLHGQMADIDPILAIARRHRLFVIEDAAQAHGAEYKGRRAGSLGDIGCFSFYPGKNLGGYGEGGAIVSDNVDLMQRVTMLRDWGQERKYHHVVAGYNYRMDGIQGAVLRVKLNYIEAWTDARRAIAATYDNLLSGSAYQRPARCADSRHVYHVYAVALDHRDEVQAAMQAAGIVTGIHYPIPVHRQPAYAGMIRQPFPLPVTEALAARLLSLPIYAELGVDQITEVVRVLEQSTALETA
jgi:dTDP-4-amino-4,6-dideoxygalactose transaminase